MSFLLHRVAVLSTPALALISGFPLAVAVGTGVAIHNCRTRKAHL